MRWDTLNGRAGDGGTDAPDSDCEPSLVDPVEAKAGTTLMATTVPFDVCGRWSAALSRAATRGAWHDADPRTEQCRRAPADPGSM